MWMSRIVIHRASIASGQLDFGGGRILKVLRIISPAVLIKKISGHRDIDAKRNMYCNYLGFHIKPSLPLVAEEDEDTQGLPDLGDPFKWSCLKHILINPNV